MNFLCADIPPDPSAKRSEDDGKFRQVYFGRLVRFPLNAMRACASLEPQTGEEGETRQLITMFDVKKRVFYGNTSMEAEISLLMANQAQVSGNVFKDDIVLDSRSSCRPLLENSFTIHSLAQEACCMCVRVYTLTGVTSRQLTRL